MRNERIDLITKTPKNKIFITSMLVIPAFYRDIKPNQNGGGETDDINQMYGKLIRESTLIRDRDMFDIQFHNTNFSIQNTLVDIYNYFKTKIEKKNGLIRKYLMGKNVDYCTRVVITAPNFHADRPEELITDMRHAAIPISHICSLCFPFIMRWVKIFFEREVLDSQASKILYDPVTGESIGTMELDNPETYFNEKYYKKMIDSFIKDPESRFNKIEIPVKGGQKKYLAFTGKHVDTSNTADISPLASRPMTWTDLLYMAAEDVVKDKHCLITRYPLLDEFGIYVGKIRVLSTTKTTVMRVNDTIFKWYPVVDLEIPTEQIGSSFIDSIQFSNSCLPGLDGDYDGDQITAKIAFTQEANAEMEAYMNSKSYFINASGQNIRYVESEAIQTFYTMTKEPPKGSRILPKEEKMKFVRLNPKDITFEKLVDWFGDLANEEENKIKKSPDIKAMFSQRVLAFLIDLVLLSMITSLITMFIPMNDTATKLYEEQNRVLEDYVAGNVPMEEYVNQMIDLGYDISKQTVIISIVTIVISLLYYVVYPCYNNGQTLGKKLMGVRVVSATGDEKVSMNQYVLRSLLVNSLVCNILLIGMVLFMSRDVYFYTKFTKKNILIDVYVKM